MKEVRVRTKDIRRAAFAVGFGFTFGAWAARGVTNVIDVIATKCLKDSAQRGNKTTQDICQKSGMVYEENPEEDDSKIEMGFHC